MALFNKNKSKFLNREVPTLDPSHYQAEEDGESKEAPAKLRYVPPPEETGKTAPAPPPPPQAPTKPSPPTTQEAEAAAEARAGRFSSLFRGQKEPASKPTSSSEAPAPQAPPVEHLPASKIESKADSEVKAPSSPQPQQRGDYARTEMKAEETRPGAAAAGYRPLDAASTITIEKNSKFSGQLKFSGTIAVDGQVEGEIIAEKVLVHDGGSVIAKIESDSVVISGTVKGDIFAKKDVEVAAAGTLTGNVTAPALLIRPGGCLEGKCSIGRRS